MSPLPALAQGAQPEADAETTPAPPAEADDSRQDTQLEQAMRAYKSGTKNYNRAQYDAALADFKEAATLYASPDFQYNIGLCYEKLGKNEEAVRAYVTYLKTKPNAEDRPNVEDRIQRLQERIEQGGGETQPPPPDDVGPVEPDDKPPENTEPEDDGRPLIIAGAALAGVGAVIGLGGGIAFGALARQRSVQIDDIQEGGNPDELTFTEAEDIEAQGKRLEAIQIAFAAGGAAIAVTGAVLLALGLRKRKNAVSTSAWLGPSTAGVAISGRF